jgi:hypothetical protein
MAVASNSNDRLSMSTLLPLQSVATSASLIVLTKAVSALAGVERLGVDQTVC